MPKTPDKITFRGATYIKVTAQLQQLLQQYETQSKKLLGFAEKAALIKTALENAHKAAMGKNFAQSTSLLKELQTAANEFKTGVDALIDLSDTMAGHVGMGGA